MARCPDPPQAHTHIHSLRAVHSPKARLHKTHPSTLNQKNHRAKLSHLYGLPPLPSTNSTVLGRTLRGACQRRHGRTPRGRSSTYVWQDTCPTCT